MEDEKIDLKWGRFGTRMLLALGLLIIGILSGLMLQSESHTKRLIGCALNALTFIAMALAFRQGNLGKDEYERRIETLAFAQAGLWAVGYVLFMTIYGALRPTVPSPIWIYTGPALVIGYQSMMSQYMRWAIANGKSVKFEKLL